jgi:ribosomal protein S18 acetylase RimI-like enzyme
VTDDALAGLVHRNLMDVNARLASPRGEVIREDGTLLFAANTSMPFLNGVMREAGAGDAADLIERARGFFLDRDRGFVAFAWPGDPELEEAARGAGMFPVLEGYPEMVCRSKLAALDAEVREVQSVDDASAYWEVCEAAYPSLGFPPGLFSEAFRPEDLLADDVWACLAISGEGPLACASVFLAGGVGMVAWVAARPEARGRGLAAACTVAATNRAFELGAEVASLQASVMGEDLYRKLGYEELFSYRLLGAMPD